MVATKTTCLLLIVRYLFLCGFLFCLCTSEAWHPTILKRTLLSTTLIFEPCTDLPRSIPVFGQERFTEFDVDMNLEAYIHILCIYTDLVLSHVVQICPCDLATGKQLDLSQSITWLLQKNGSLRLNSGAGWWQLKLPACSSSSAYCHSGWCDSTGVSQQDGTNSNKQDCALCGVLCVCVLCCVCVVCVCVAHK